MPWDLFRTVFVTLSLGGPLLAMLFGARALWEARAARPERDWPPALCVSPAHVLQEARTGDILLFSGSGADSALIRGWSWSPWTHCAMVVCSAQMRSPRKFAWHANVNDGWSDVRTCRPLADGGAQLNDLARVLHEYQGAVFWRPLSNAVEPALLFPAIKELADHGFNHDYADMLSCTRTPIGLALRALRGSDACAAPERHFCSELMARTYQLCGVLGRRPPALYVHPCHFASPDDRALPWVEPYRPGFLYWIRRDTPAIVRGN